MPVDEVGGERVAYRDRLALSGLLLLGDEVLFARVGEEPGVAEDAFCRWGEQH